MKPRAPEAAISEVVLAAVRKGELSRLDLNREQIRAMDDLDGRRALDALAHWDAAHRKAAPASVAGRYPLTPETLQACLRKIGYGHVGTKRCRTMRRRLFTVGAINEQGRWRNSGSKRVPGGFLLILYSAVLRSAVKLAPAQATRCSARENSLVGRGTANARVSCWHHPLFGTLDGLPPPSPGGARTRRRLTNSIERRAGLKRVRWGFRWEYA